jgi:molybdenum cofactor biosynthesis enzyme
MPFTPYGTSTFGDGVWGLPEFTNTNGNAYGSKLYGSGGYSAPYPSPNVSTTATSSVSVNYVILRTVFADPQTISASATSTCSARRVPEGSALLYGTSVTSVDTTLTGARVRESSGSMTSSATTSAAGQRVRESDALAAAQGTTATIFERVREIEKVVESNSTIVNSYERVRTIDESISVTSATEVAPVRVKFFSASTSASSTISGNAVIIANAKGSMSSASTFTSAGQRVRESDSLVSSNATVSSIFRRVRTSASSVTSVAANVVAYERDRNIAPPEIAASSTTTVNVERVRLDSAAMESAATSTCNGRYTARGYGIAEVDGVTSIIYERVRKSDTAIASESVTVAIAREKWEIIPQASDIWTTIPEASDIWTTIPESSNTWTNIAA